ncbi:MAG: hypothetical protein ACTSQ6_00570 [Candidatus Heimdallarchaeaceae archaeon]
MHNTVGVYLMYKNKYNPIKVIVKIPSRERKIVSSRLLLPKLTF